MTDIYTQHDKAFARVSAAVILGANGDKVATIAIKFPADGAGRLYAYVHWLGSPMVRGSANGYGYDKRTAAISAAASNIELADWAEFPEDKGLQEAHLFKSTLAHADAGSWDSDLGKAGFKVLTAI